MIPSHGIGKFLLESHEAVFLEPLKHGQANFDLKIAGAEYRGFCVLMNRARFIFGFCVGTLASAEEVEELAVLSENKMAPVENYEITEDGKVWLTYAQTVIEPVNTLELKELFAQIAMDMRSFESTLQAIQNPNSPQSRLYLHTPAGSA